jgi:dienelactone hydrolase
MSQEEFQSLLQFFKVLADENRLKLLGILANGEKSVEELAALLQLRAPTISHHLARLKELDLVGVRNDGNIHFYWLNAEALRRSNKLILTPEKMASLVDIADGDSWERKVLRDFFEGSRLKEIPASVKKRGVILKWLANQFEYSTVYTEAQVNEIIQRHHPDSASLRRELISAKNALMQREGGLYWRIPTGERWRTITLKAADKLPLQGHLGVPDGKGPFPTILEIHEGPSVQSQSDWLSPIAQSWVDAGFAYLVISFPGIQQGRFGLTFQERIMGHPGRWEVEDLLTAHHWLLEQGIAHPQQIILTGWSYSAFISLLAAGQHPDLWAGVIAGNVLTDWIAEYESGLDQELVCALFDGSSEEKRDTYLMSSPITYVGSVTAPICIIQGRDTLFYSAQQAELYLEKMLAAGKPIDIRWQDVPASMHDVELMVKQQQTMLEVARSMIMPPNND